MSRDLTFWSLRQKKAALSRRRVVVVAGSKQDAALARQSSLFAKTRVTVIPVPVDERVFRPTPRELARQVLDLALERKTVFAAARRMSDARKGFQVLLEGLHRLRADDPFLAAQMTILTAGDDPPPELFRLPYEVRHLGVLRDDRSLALAYQAADVYVSPSLEDSGPMMVLESLCCGTPIVAFPVGYAADLLAEHRVGAVAPLGDAVGLVAAIRRVLALAPQEKAELDLACRRAALVYCASSFVAAKYREIYRELAEQKGVAL
jgi:glycosyltransferase involved in cell wall biosynthesis